MKIQEHRPSAWVRLWLPVVVVSWFVAAGVLVAQISGGRAGRVVFPEYYEKAVMSGQRTNQLKGRLLLEKFDYLPNRVIYGQVMRLEQYTPDGHTNLVARAPECYFNETSRVAWSTGRLEISVMEGQVVVSAPKGFQASLTNTALELSNRVRTVFKQNLMKMSPP